MTGLPARTPPVAQPASAIVVGGGIGGSAVALLLARAGTEVTLLERSEDPVALGAGILLQANGLAVLYGLGLRAGLHLAACELDAVRLYRADGAALADQPVPDLGGGLDHLLALRRSTLARVLEAAIAAEPAIAVRLGAQVIGAGREGAITYEGPSGRVTVTADLVIAADGVHSVVRRCGEFGGAEIRTGSAYLRALVDTSVPFRGEAWTELGLFGSTDVSAGAYLYADATHPDVAAALERRDLAALTTLWSAAFPPSRALWNAVPHIDHLLCNDVTTVRCQRWTDGRLVLLGDAAHAMEPTAGQGANSALVDAAVLARELASSSTLEDALERYDAVRRPAVSRVQRDADRLARLSRVRSPLGRALRDRAIRIADRRSLAARRYRRLQQEDPAELRAVIAATRPLPTVTPGSAQRQRPEGR